MRNVQMVIGMLLCFMIMTVGLADACADRPPVLAAIGSKTVKEGRLLSFTLSAKDPDGNKIVYSAFGLPKGAKLSKTTGKFTWTPGSGTAGKYTIKFIATANVKTDSETMKITVVSTSVPTTPSTKPSITLTSVAPYGSSGSASGTVGGVDTSAYKVAVYIYVSGWWNKPYWASPLTTINSNGKWTCDIDTGGNDIYATKVIAFVIPKTYKPPELHGGNLPSELYTKAVAYTEVKR